MPDIFISYAHEDHAVVGRMVPVLEAEGFSVWWDHTIPPGKTWDEVIARGITDAKCCIVVWSQHSVGSDWVKEEATIAKEGKKIIPVQIDGSEPPMGFRRIQAANLQGWAGDAGNAQWQLLVREVRGIVAAAGAGGAAAPPPPLSQPRPAYQPAYAAAPQASAGASSEQLSPIGYIQKCFRLYANGKGRARRAEFWWWVLFTFIVGLITGVLDMAAFGINPYTGQVNSQVFNTLANLALLAPNVSVQSRRLHDIGASGWWAAGLYSGFIVGSALIFAAMPTQDAATAGLGVLLVIAAAIASLVVGLIPGKSGPNAYGPDPKAS